LSDPATGDGGGRLDGTVRPSGRRTDGDLPEYSVRVSARARRVRLVMSSERGLEVVVPRGFDRRMIPGLLESRRVWIARAAARVAVRAENKRLRLQADPPRLPKRIVLPALEEEWDVEYVERAASAGSAFSRRTPGVVARERSRGLLVVSGDIDEPSAAKAALCRWLVRKARARLLPRLAELARRHALEYERAAVRQQRTRWASCSRRGTISLNARLLFLTPEVVDHVMLHELCHTREMNHSPRFWTLLEACDPDWRAHRGRLRDAGAALPTWLDHELRSLDDVAL